MNWTEEEVRLALALYCQLPFGKLHRGNPEVIALAQKIGRTPSAVAMKLVNIASLDPAIRESGRSGLGNASALDRDVWTEFGRDWEGALTPAAEKLGIEPPKEWTPPETVVQTTREASVKVRTKQYIFRRMILSGYGSRCCMSGLAIEKCLVASHIKEWSKFESERLNPHNGLCLSALHDKAFEHGYITVTPDYVVRVSGAVAESKGDDFALETLGSLSGKPIRKPERFVPSPDFLAWHEEKKFLGA